MMVLSKRFVIISGWLFAVLTVSACSKSTPSAPTATCAFTVGQPSLSAFPPEGGTATASVTAGSTCTWTATSGSSFVNIGQGSSGTGNGTVQFTVAPNSGSADRSGTLSVAGTTLNITQRGATPTPTPVTLSAPTANSPIGGVAIISSRPTLVVNNSTATGSVGTVAYRFEVSDQNTFPNDPVRTFTADGVPQGTGTTGWVLTRDLGPNVLWYWRARSTNGGVTSAFSNTETFRTGISCTYTIAPTTVSALAGGGSFSVTVTTDSACTWAAASQSSFITLTSGATGSGNGTVAFSVAATTTGARTGTLTIAGQTVTVSQGGVNFVAGFRLLDPGRLGTATTTDCWLRSLTSQPTQCTLESTSFPLGTNAITGYSWVVSYTYANEKAFTQVGTSPRFTFSDICGLTGSNDSGFQLELKVSLTVTDSEGNSVTVRSNAGNQPLLTLRAYICGI
jgi:all-beta uncharacterized protein